MGSYSQTLVIGGSGLVGSNVSAVTDANGATVTGTYRTEETESTTIHLDKTDANEVNEVVEEVNPDAIIDTAAFHDVDACETDRDLAWTVNATGTRNVAVAANEVEAHLVYLSTDYVFPGNPEETPYHEDDPVNPCDYYAETKYAGERAARIADRCTVLRPSVIYGIRSDNFVTWVLNELESGQKVGIVDDQVSTPTYAPDVARAAVEVIKEDATGLYHAAGPKSLSRYEFTLELAQSFGLDTDLIDPITTAELGQEAPRPADSTLDSTALYETLGYEFASPSEAFSKIRERR